MVWEIGWFGWGWWRGDMHLRDGIVYCGFVRIMIFLAGFVLL